MDAINNNSLRGRLVRRAAFGFAVFTIMVVAGIQISQAGEIVPAVGLTRAKDATETHTFGSLALRGNILPMIQTELGASYRSETIASDALKVKMWPVTASLWLTPVPAIYAGGGVGWYHTTLDYDSATGFDDETREEFGVHLGGGLKVPVGPMAAVDLGGRYVMMRDQESKLIPEHFSADFWQTTLGLAIRF